MNVYGVVSVSYYSNIMLFENGEMFKREKKAESPICPTSPVTAVNITLVQDRCIDRWNHKSQCPPSQATV